MPFIDFLYANLHLGPPPGKEDQVGSIRAYKGREYVTGCYAFSPEELEEINRTGCLWISFMGDRWPPVKLDSWIPAHRPFNIEVYGADFMVSGDTERPPFLCLAYLDLALVFLRADPDHSDFIWRERSDLKEEFGKDRILDLEYRDHGSAVHSGGRYLFSETLEVLGRYKDLERLHPLSLIYPFLTQPEAQEYLVLSIKEPPPDQAEPPDQSARIIQLN